MRKLIAAEFLTLDGVMEAPGSADTTLPERRGWSEPYMTEEIGKIILDQMDASDALLLGRKTYQDFAAFWPSVPDEDPFGKKMNSFAKYVVSKTLNSINWNNSRLIRGNVAEEVSRLKAQPGKNINIVGSGELVRSLMQNDLIDEYQLMVCPVLLGVGKRLFNEGSDKKSLRLVDTKAFDSGMLLLTYRSEK
jgi:dihydrofolate reductase